MSLPDFSYSNNFSPNGQNDQQPNTEQDPATWPPCERCGAGAPLKTQFGDLCDECYAIIADQVLSTLIMSDGDLCAIMAANSGNGGDRPELGHDLVRPAEFGDRCYECGAKPAAVIERRITASEIRFYCEFCLLPETEPIPFLPRLRDEPDDQLCAIMAANSGKNGNRALLRAARLELEARTQELSQDPPTVARRSFLAGLFGLVAVAMVPGSNAKPDNATNVGADISCIIPSRVPDSPTVTHWQAQFDRAIDALTALRDGIGTADITGQRFYELETAVFNVLGDLVEQMETGPFDELVVSLGIKNDYLAALGILSQYQAEKAAYEAEGGSDDR